jgi:hypothetical protein
MTYIRPLSRGGIVTAGLNAPWTFFPVVVVFGGIALSVLLGAWLPVEVYLVWIWVYPAWVAFVALLWYFVIARIPDHIRVASIRTAAPDAALVYGVRLGRSAQAWVAEVLRADGGPRPSGFGAAVVGTTTEMQIWMGSASESVPVATMRWAEVARVAPAAGRGSGIRIVQAPRKSSIEIRVVNAGWLATVLARGSARDRVIEQLERLRTGPSSQTQHYSQVDSQ